MLGEKQFRKPPGGASSLCTRWVERVGEGHFASVFKATRKADGLTVAVKEVETDPYNMVSVRGLEREVFAMKHLRHDGVVSAHEVFNSTAKVHIVMDLVEGGTLKDNVQENGSRVSESQAAPIIWQILEACAHFHKHGYVHRDLKLENVLCEEPGIDNAKVKVADFGFVNFVDDPRHACLRSMLGTPVYIAPEIARGVQYGAAADMYAMGVMLYRMLSGWYPFDGEDEENTLKLAVDGKLEWRSSLWSDVSEDCKEFVKTLLSTNASLRYTAEEALQHPWLLSVS